MTILIAITGGSGSGKSTLAEAIVSALPAGAAALVREDSYYRMLRACRTSTRIRSISTMSRRGIIC